MDKYQGMVYSEALRYTRSQEEAEDLTQEIFLKAFEKLSTFKGTSKFPTWLYRIGRNMANMKYRKRVLPESNRELLSQAACSKSSPERIAIDKETRGNIRDHLSRLPGVYQNPIFMYYFENMSYQEISDKLNLKVNTLKSYILRGKELLKNWLQNET
ncbi:MAG: sigma-70 family RNA polymerase sigma factor [Leptospiraceae bacterium]|nr:sigma-70 family RNA polymerase sigma factor [Leptospiraceae bacterium]MCP5512486.1 sigma-70 family RNA polymerase sigma factor [Leptospiraceae bacterium]